MKFFSTTLLLIFVFANQAFAQSADASHALSSLIKKGALPKLLAGGFGFTEGPAADASGNIYFTDIGNNRIHHWNVVNEELTTVRENSGGADGLFVDRQGALWICELNNKQLTKLSKNGDYEVVVDAFEGKPLTGANDLWIDQYGGIYFSDSYAGSQKKEDNHRVFYRSPDGDLKLVVDNFYKSNGLQGTLDGNWLYISDYIDNKVYRYELIEPGKVGERTVFAHYRCDGMTLDENDNLYISTGNAGHGIVIIDPQGEELGKISIPENPSNVCFGGKNYNTLYISATNGFYSLEMNVKGNFYNSPQKPIVTDEGGLADLLSHNALPIRLATGFKIAQGPAAAKNGDVYFSDIFHDKIFKWSFGDEQLSLFRNQPGGPDGLYFEKDGSLLVCELTGKRFARLSTNGQYEIIAEEFEGTSLTGANDVYVDNQGGIYFSDSFPGSVLRGPKFCVYYIAPGQNSLKKIIDDHYKTKGIHISEDGKWIYIADFGGRKVYRYELKSPGVLGKKELFIDTRCGGLTVDEYGNVYISTVGDHGGVLVFDLDGKKLGKIMFPENTTNVTFAGPNRDKLLITTFKSIYSLDMNVKGLGNNYKTE